MNYLLNFGYCSEKKTVVTTINWFGVKDNIRSDVFDQCIENKKLNKKIFF